jgi:alpha-L-rhamnosidase
MPHGRVPSVTSYGMKNHRFLLRPPLLACCLALSASAALTPVDLRCDGMRDSIAASDKPKFSWRVDSQVRGEKQTAWQILVASSSDILIEHRGDLWDSGKQPATREPYVIYAGAPLSPGVRYHCKVRCWGADGKESDWSIPTFLEVAPMKPADWLGAKWIDDGKPQPEKDEDFYQPDPAPLMRKEFTISKPVVRARLHMAGLGYAYASLNGGRINDNELGPPWTNFDKHILFNTYDVSVHEGVNCLGLTLGNGWYNPLPLRMWGGKNIREALPTGRPRSIALLVVDHPDGTKTTVTTGPDWKFAEGPTLRNSVFLGEERDARLEKTNWDTADFDASSWKPVHVTDAPLEPLTPILDMPPVKQTGIVIPKAVTTPAPGTYIVDFGENFTGVPEIKLNVPAGTRIQMRYGEILHDDGTLNPMTSVCGQIKGVRKNDKGEEHPIGGPGAPHTAWQQDVYIARGGPEKTRNASCVPLPQKLDRETYRPDFTFHAFRYMEITGLPAAPKMEDESDIYGIRMHSALPDAGSFSCSNELFNRIQKITRNTFTNNVISVQSDCPHRERFGYGGDISVTSEAFLFNYDMSGFYAKTIRDFADAARPDGDFTDTAPFVGIQYCGVGWAMTHPLLLEQLYQHHGNKSLIEEQLPAAIRWFDLEASKRKDGLVVLGLGDHEAMPKIKGPVLGTPMFIDTANRMARLCRIIGNEKDAMRFSLMAGESAGAWAKAFLDEKTGKIGGGSQSEQVIALAYGTLLEPAEAKVCDYLVAELKSKPDGPALTTGIFGTRFLLEELTQHGRHDLAYALADRKTFPSWGWMLENGATTLWETWKESDNTFSHNHPMFGSISAWFFRHLGGIQIADDAIGADRIIIRPQTGHGLTWVKSSHQSVRGKIESNWKMTDKGTEFDIVIPPDTTAQIDLPAGMITSFDAAGNPGAVVRDRQMKVGSGRYRFLVSR